MIKTAILAIIFFATYAPNSSCNGSTIRGSVSSNINHRKLGNIATDDWLYAGNGAFFPSNNEVVFESASSSANEFGVILTQDAYNDDDIDFQIDYTQTDYPSQSGYQPQIYLFFVTEGTSPDTLLQTDNNFGDFLALTVGHLKSKVWAPSSGSDHTYFYASTGNGHIAGGQFDLSLRLRRLDNVIYAYYELPTGDWVSIGTPTPLSGELQNVPLQFGCRVKKEWRAYHQFTLTTNNLAVTAESTAARE